MAELSEIEYLYRPTLRPASFATLPGIEWDYVEAPANDPAIGARRGIPVSRYPFGIIATTKRLTREERDRFGLAIV